MPLTEDEWNELRQLQADPSVGDDQKQRAQKLIDNHDAGQRVASRLDPSMPLLPQALAVQPATTHPDGDEAAANEWLSDPTKASVTGSRYYFEPPVELAKKELASKPEMLQALSPHPDTPVTAEELAGLNDQNALYQAYADHKWKEAAEQAAQDGTTAYRYSKAPWLHGGENGPGLLKTLTMKLAGSAMPLTDLKNAFVLGADQATTGGTARRISEHFDPDSKAENAHLEEDHPIAELGGGIVGALSGWGPANAAYKIAVGKAAPLAGAIANEAPGVLNSLGRAGLSAGAGALGAAAGGAASQGLSEGVNAVADATEGKPLAVPEGAGARMGVAALGGGLLGGALGSVGGVANEAKNFVETSNRYKEVPEFLHSGGKLTTGGPVPGPGIEPLLAEAKAQRMSPIGLQATKVAPMIEESTGTMEAGNRQEIARQKEAFYQTPEGKQRLPATNTAGKVLSLLDEYTAPKEGGPKTPIVEGAPAGYLKSVFNSETEHPSFEMHPGAMKLEPEQANVYLSDGRKAQLLGDQNDSGGKVIADISGKDLKDLGVSTLDKSSDARVEGIMRDPEFKQSGRVSDPQSNTLNSLPTLVQFPGEPLKMSNGRHRLIAARNAGLSHIDGVVRTYDADGKQIGVQEGRIKVSEAPEQITKPVYVSPRRYNAAEQETAINQLKELPSATTDPFRREKQQLYAAAMSDRDQRPMNGKVGGWSMLRGQHAQMTEAAKAEVARATPTDQATNKPSAFQPLKQYAHERDNVPVINALRDSAVRGGALGELEKMRQLGVLDRLQGMAGLGSVGGLQRSPVSPAALMDIGMLRGHPLMDRLSGPINPRWPALGNAVTAAGERQLEQEDKKP